MTIHLFDFGVNDFDDVDDDVYVVYKENHGYMNSMV